MTTVSIITRGTTDHEPLTMPERELRQRIDVLMYTGFTELDARDYRDELRRRETDRQSKRLELLT
jgi:hypothetical protein